MYNQGAYNSNMPRIAIQDIHEYNENFTNRGSSRLNEEFPIQRRSV